MMQEILGDKLNRHIDLLEQDPNNVNLLMEIGQIYLDSDDVDNALVHIEKAACIDHKIRLIQARLFHRLQNLDKAIEVIQTAISIDSDDADALGLLSLFYFDSNDFELAQDTANKALSIDSSNYEAKLVKILVGLPMKETDIKDIEELLAENSDDPRLHFALGNTLMTEGNVAEAAEALQKAIDIYPPFYDAYIILAWCQLLNNRANSALDTYEKASKIAPKIADAWGGLAVIYALKGDLIKAEKMINKATKLNPECFFASLAESIYFAHKNPSKANKDLTKALKSTQISTSEKVSLFVESLEATHH